MESFGQVRDNVEGGRSIIGVNQKGKSSFDGSQCASMLVWNLISHTVKLHGEVIQI